MKRYLIIATVLAISFLIVKWLLFPTGRDHFVRGNEHYDLENYAAAAKAYTAAIEANPRYTDAYFNRAMSLSYMGDCLAAVDDFSRAIKLRSDSVSSNIASAYHNRGVCYLRLGKAEQALDDYNRAIEIDPTQALYFFNRGLRYVDMNKIRRARIDFQRASRLARADSDDKLAGKISKELRLLP